MKKNWVLRLGLLAMVLTLVTMPMVSSTYAKYVTAATGSDSARVAKWGVKFTADATGFFAPAYEEGVDASSVESTWIDVNDSLDYTGISVNALTDTGVVAPGTTGSFTYTIAGRPEVKLALTLGATITRTGWTVVTANDYDPINWTVTNPDGDFLSYTAADGETAASVAWVDGTTYLKADVLEDALALVSDTYEANQDFTGKVYTVSWVWPFEVAGTAITNTTPDPDVLYTFDQADTIIAGLASAPTLAINLTITATQIN